MSAVWRRSAVLRFPTSSRSHTLTRRGLGLPFLPAVGRKLTLSAICILKRRALARLVLEHRRTRMHFCANRFCPSHMQFSISHASDAHSEPRLHLVLSITERVSWHSDERSCLMSQLSEDRPGTSARESEIQPLR